MVEGEGERDVVVVVVERWKELGDKMRWRKEGKCDDGEEMMEKRGEVM